MINRLLEVLLFPLREPIAKLADKARLREQEAREHARRNARPWKAEADAYDERMRQNGAQPKAEEPAKKAALAPVRPSRVAPSTINPETFVQASASMTPDLFFAKFSVRCFFHFTDERNLPSIRNSDGLWSMRALQERCITVPAPGGDANSQFSDSRNGMDRYVHLCLFNQNPMEYRARQDGRIGSSRFLEIDRNVLRLEGVRFTSAMANQSGVTPLTLNEAAAQLDFAAAYERMDFSNQEQMQRVLAARKYELLIPNHVPIRYIRGL